ncbi:RDD family protein [Nocardioides sp. Root140]|uniref:RDD family protein n=1 Tax=Nocardioides sp. Root140 TaxID=1736460 RepID=UPI0006F5905F|nr:RDD family protein [Nocardioides sp. Root140]KQY56655.1 hypothetical protein ASD30_10070 [Nocardioides sp. Root140]
MSLNSESALAAEPERRFQAFVVDRAVAWSLFAAAGVAAWWWFFREGSPWPGVALVAGTVLVVSVVFAVLLGTRGTSPGKALFGLRVVSHEGGGPIGVGKALLRTLVVGLGSLPMFGLGLATLAWTAVEDRSRERRGWHDQVAGSVVVDVRPRPVAEVAVEERPRHVVNLTAMKLVPVRHAPKPVGAALSGAPGRTSAGPATGPTTGTRTGTPTGTPTGRPTSTPTAPPALSPEPPAPPTQVPAARPVQAPEPQPPAPRPAVQLPQAPTAPRQAGRNDGLSDRTVPGGVVEHPDAPSTSPGPRTRVTWRITFDSGETFVVEGLGVLGRQPVGRPGEPVRHVVPLRSEDMSISKTHAQFHLASDGALVFIDRGSTNGSLLVRKGVSRELTAGRPATLVDGDRVVFGDRQMKVSREDQ